MFIITSRFNPFRIACFSLTFLFIISTIFPAQNDNSYIQLDADFHSRIRIDLEDTTFQLLTTSPFDSMGIGFLGSFPIDNSHVNIKLRIAFEDEYPVVNRALYLDEAYIEVKNVFSILDFKFFDIGYGAGMNNSIRPDLPVQGMEITVHPLSTLSISLGYGIATKELDILPISNNNVQTTLNGEETQYTPNYHALKFDLFYDNLYVPTGIYYGITFIDNVGSYLAKDYLPEVIQDQILHTSVGFSMDFLAYYKRQALSFDMGFGIPLGTMSRYVILRENGEYSYDPEFNFLLQFYGDIDIIFGIGLKYQIFFSLDTHTKQKTLGNLDDEYFKETFKVLFAPRYTYGPIRADIGILFGIVGKKASQSSLSRRDSIIYKRGVYNNFTVEIGTEWTPFPFKDMGRGISVRGYYKVDFGDIDNPRDHHHVLGMRLNLFLNSLAID